ncbi:aminoglycoside phosphotransferase family protein [Micromonospora sp. WMMD961]|uniref:phosphotransferase enzyme family protein n=1 Tax=Micromonospora sp. WMMD961 TaxID=3016100 RepID=UPI002418080D|nr:aminoglycoside phosphotransferase family protein [Micromonospora sp. WMMD961]MDG4781404.1 aminoglycoside phosphotransferase family protein [Micromonospora sp. WMMD961]
MSDHSANALGEQEEVLPGGNMGGATRVGATVRRPAGAWSPTIQRLLRHLRERGVTWVPQPLGSDEHGRDVVSYLPGIVPQYPLPDWIWREDVLTEAGVYLADLHGASASFDTVSGVWRFPVRQPAEVICHNDFAPYNMVFTDRRLTGVIDWDTASPGPRSWDLAYLAYRLVPLADPDNGDAIDSDLDQRARRLRMLCDAYGSGQDPAHILHVAVHRLHDLAAFTEARADQGQEGIRHHVGLYQRDARWITAHADQLHG